MTDTNAILALARKQLQYPLPAASAVNLTTDHVYATDASACKSFDLYLPASSRPPAGFPVVVHVNGYPFPPEFRKIWMPTVSWARLLAANGIASVIYDCSDPQEDKLTLLSALLEKANELAIDPESVALMACSGHGPTALRLLVESGSACSCAVLNYPFLLDLDGDDAVAKAASQFGFADASHGIKIDDLPDGLSLMIVRAGRDAFAGLNEGIEKFSSACADTGVRVQVLENAQAAHGFDMDDDSQATREIIRQILDYFRGCLL